MSDKMKELVKCFVVFNRLFDSNNHPEVVKALEDMRKRMYEVNDEFYDMHNEIVKLKRNDKL